MGIKDRKRREREKRREQILESARVLFLRRGFHATTMEDIANKAELSPGTLYLYFENKGELYFSLNLIALEYLLSEVKQVYSNKELPVEEKILKVKEGMYKMYKHDPLVLHNIMHAQLEDTLLSISPELVGKINHLAREIMNTIADIYEEGVRQGKFREGHKMAHADIMWALFTGIVLWEQSKKNIEPRKDFLKSTLDLAFDTYLKGIIR